MTDAQAGTTARRYRPSRRREILDAALDEISVNGYGDTTLAAIAKRVGITIAAVYYHFDGKMAVFMELVDEIGRSIAGEFAGIRAETLRGLIVESYGRFADWAETHPKETELYFDRAAGVSREVEQLQRAWINGVASEVGDRTLRLHPGLDPLTAGVIGLAVPVLLGEYARIRRGTAPKHWAVVQEELAEALSQMADRMELFAERAARGAVVRHPETAPVDAPPVAGLTPQPTGSRTGSAGSDPNSERRSRVIEAAISVFADKGIEGASVIEIAAHAGVPRATVYDDFGSKDGLLAAAVAHVADEISAVEENARQREPYPGCMVERVAAVFRWVEGHPGEAWLLYRRARAAGAEAVHVIEDMVQRHTGGAAAGPAGALLVRRVAVQTGVATVTAWLSEDYFPVGTNLTDLIVPQARLQSCVDGRPDPPPPVALEQRTWALGPEERVSLVMRIIRGESPAVLALQSGMEAEILRRWVHHFIEGGRRSLAAECGSEPGPAPLRPQRRPRPTKTVVTAEGDGPSPDGG